MAASGDILIVLKSVDYPYPYTRGAQTQTHTLGFNVTDSGDLSFSWKSVSYDGSIDPYPQYWWVCSSAPYHLDVEFSTDGNNWTPIIRRQVFNSVTQDCSRGYTVYPVIEMIQDLVSQLGTVHLTESGYVRIFTYAEDAAPSAALPYAYPTSAYSSAVAVPIYIEVSWDATLKFDANGGSGAPADIVKTVQNEDSTTITIPSTIPTRTWHRFDGWNTDRTATTVQYRPGDNVTIQKSNPTVTLYAVWTEYYRVGAKKVSDGWDSHMKSGGASSKRVGGEWVEMRTIDGGQATNDPPQIRKNGTWVNMSRIGRES